MLMLPSLPVALLSSVACELTSLRMCVLCFFLTYFYFFTSLFIRVSSAMIIYDRKNTFGHWTALHYPDSGHFIHGPSVAIGDTSEQRVEQWPPEKPQETRKHRGRRAGIRNRLRERAHSPPLPSILLANVQSLENKMDHLRARISFQRGH